MNKITYGLVSVATAMTLLLPTLASAAVIYNAVPSPLPPNAPSVGYQATQTAQFGDYVHLGGTDRVLTTVTVTMSDWALFSDYSTDARYLGDSSNWTHPITLNIYSNILDANGVPTTLLATKTEIITIPWRPVADPTCSTPTAWRNPSDTLCYNGLAFNAAFDLSSLNVTLPNDVIVGIAYNTNTWGSSPIGLPGPYESLNVAVPASQPVAVGSDDSVDKVFWNTMTASNYTTPGLTGVFREDSAWTPNGTVAMQINANPPAPTTGPVWIETITVNHTLDVGEPFFTTIQAAVNAAVGGDTIQVTAGTYPEHVTVNKSLTINGKQVGVDARTRAGAESIVDGTDTGTPFAITANNVTINGFIITNGSNGSLNSGIWSQTGTLNSKILNNIITQNGIGVWAQCGGSCLIQGNLFNGNNKPGAGSGSASISADRTIGLTINNNEFKNDTAGNPILLQAVGAGAHTSVVVSNNTFRDNTNSNIYVLGVTGGTFSGNTITPASDATGISFSGADANITVTNNVITGGARGVRIEDAGFYGSAGGNSNITVNRNNVSSDTGYGVGNTDATISNLNATCNWWGAANGPSAVGSGSGDPVTLGVTFTPWLTTSDLAQGLCNGVAPPTPTVQVHIFKYVNGVQATAGNANGASFPMLTTFNSPNLGIATNAPFTLSPTGWGSTDSAYEASFVGSVAGADYAAHEVTGGSVVGASCADGKPFALVGYSTGDTLALATTATTSTTTPSFTSLQSDHYVIVWNRLCPTTGSIMVTKNTIGGNGTFNFTGTLGGFSITTAGGTGSHTVANLAPGTYIVTETPAPGWNLTSNTCSVIAVAAGQTATCVVTNTKQQLSSISGIKYNDLNRNGKKDAGEPGLPGWTIKLEKPNGTVITTTVTSAGGNYSFTNLPAGTYKLREVHQNGWKRMSKNPKPIVLVAGATVTNVLFGNAKKHRGDREDTNNDDQRDDESGNYYSNRNGNNYANDKDNKNHGSDRSNGRDD